MRNVGRRITWVAGLGCLAASSLCAFGAPGDASEHVGVPSGSTGGVIEIVVFYLIAAMTVVSALGVCISRNIVRMAVWLFVALASVSLLYFQLAANFLAAIQLIVYAGGTLILLIFGVMLTSKSPWAKFECGKLELLGATLVSGVLLGCLCTVLRAATWSGVAQTVPGASVADIGRRLMTTYLVPFEVAGVLLMVVMVGAAHLARQGK